MNNVTTSPDGETNSTRRAPWIDRRGSTLVFFTVVLLASCSGGRVTTVQDREAALATTVATSSDYVWVELGPDGVILARAVTTQDSCPSIKLGATTHTMQPRTKHRPPEFEDVLVCEHTLPAGTASASIGSQTLALPKASPQKIMVLGDTGCRVTKWEVQNCSGNGMGKPWNFKGIAKAIAKAQPDLIIHVGDYHYREDEGATCGSNCDQNTLGYKWAAWKADFFDPAKTLLPKAPWVFTRGNHEDCDRAWTGWFYFLDPYALADSTANAWKACPEFSAPYRVPAGNQNILVMDTSAIPSIDITQHPLLITQYAKDLKTLADLPHSPNPAWFIAHHPIWAIASFGKGNPADIARIDTTLQLAVQRQALPSSVKMLIAGHIHLFQRLTFNDNRPPQFVFGGGGTKLDPMITNLALKSYLKILGVKHFESIDNFDFGVIVPDPVNGGWKVSVKNSTGANLPIPLHVSHN